MLHNHLHLQGNAALGAEHISEAERLSAWFGLIHLKTWIIQLSAPGLNFKNSLFCLSQTHSAVKK